MKIIIAIIIFLTPIIGLNAQTRAVLEKCSLHLQMTDSSLKSPVKGSAQKLFNYNPIILPTSLNDSSLVFKNSVAEESSVFLIFSSENTKEDKIMNISYGSTQIGFSNQKVKKDKDIIYKDVLAQNGIILSYIFNLNHSKRNNYISLKDYSVLGEKSGTSLLEMLYFPLFLNDIERIKVESYLSIKYGISLLGKSDYINSDDIKIWNFEKNAGFNNMVTGIGRDDKFNLYQKQSYNSASRGLIITLDNLSENNSSNKGVLNEMNFQVWGDNGKSVEFVENKNNGIEKTERIWKVQTTKRATQHIITKVITKPNVLFTDFKLSEGKSLWLIQQQSLKDSIHVITYKATQSGDDFIFNNVNFDPVNDSLSYFSFRQAPDFFALLSPGNEALKCQNKANLAVKMFGGHSPYHISIKGIPYEADFIESKNECILQNIPSGKYRITITDSSNRAYNDLVVLSADKPEIIKIEKDWVLNKTGSCTIDPVLKNNSKDVKYEWILNDQVISVDSILMATEPGHYELLVSNAGGCSDKTIFDLSLEQLNMGEIIIYPNPVLVSGDFSVKINLTEEAEIEIEIIDYNGKMLKSVSAGLKNKFEFTDKILIPGTYLINVKLNNRSYWNKIVVQ